jgi:UDP-GlcNAc3NAcA epimerase
LKLITILGARPQFVKAAAFSAALRQRPEVQEVLVHTGQHYDSEMSQVFFEELEIVEPAYNLGIGSDTHGAQTARMLQAIEGVLLGEIPDWVVVYGDTNSTLAGALAAAKLNIPVAHIEAGLRSFNPQMPEEINRTITDHISRLLFAPTQTARRNLHNEGLNGSMVHVVGDVMYDAVRIFAVKAETQSKIRSTLNLQPRGYILATLHRAENTDKQSYLHTIVHALMRIGDELPVILPVHPRTRKNLVKANLWKQASERLTLIDPVGLLDMMILEKGARLIVTDSGGVQKEAYFHEVPCVTLRHETEWIELVKLGCNRVAPPTSLGSVISGIRAALQTKPSFSEQPFGDGHAAERILRILLKYKTRTGAGTTMSHMSHLANCSASKPEAK